MLYFRDTFRRSGRRWVLGYGFSQYNSADDNRALHDALVSHSHYLHLRRISPPLLTPVSSTYCTIYNFADLRFLCITQFRMPFTNPVVMRIFRSRIYLDDDSLARRMRIHVVALPSLQGHLPNYDLLWRNGTENVYLHSASGVSSNQLIKITFSGSSFPNRLDMAYMSGAVEKSIAQCGTPTILSAMVEWEGASLRVSLIAPLFPVIFAVLLHQGPSALP